MAFSSDVITNPVTDLGEQLRLLNQSEIELRLTLEDQLKKHLDSLSQIKKDKLEKIQNTLESEKKFQQETYKAKYEKSIKNPHLTKMQQDGFAATLQESLQSCENSMIKKQEQYAKQLDEQIKLDEKNFLEEQLNKLDELITQNAIHRENIKNKLKQICGNQSTNLSNSFRTALSQKVKEIDEKIAASTSLVNSFKVIALDEYKKMDIYLYNSTNELAQNHLLSKRDELKFALALRLAPLANYHLEDSLKLAEKAVTSLSMQIIKGENNKISFEQIAKEIEEELHIYSEKNSFEEVLIALKEECFNFTDRTEELFSALYKAKKQEYGNRFSSIASDNLIEQDKACRKLEEQVMNYLLKKIDPNQFYLTFVNLGIEAMHAKIRDQQDKHSLNDFNIHHDQVLRELNSRLDQTYDNFFVEHAIISDVKERLNEVEIKKAFFQALTRSYMKHETENPYVLRNHLTAAQVLDELENDFVVQTRLSSDQSVTTNTLQTPGLRFKDKSSDEIKFFLDLFEKEKLPQFKFFMKSKKPSKDVLEKVKSLLGNEKKSEDYRKVLDDALNASAGISHSLFNKAANAENCSPANVANTLTTPLIGGP